MYNCHEDARDDAHFEMRLICPSRINETVLQNSKHVCSHWNLYVPTDFCSPSFSFFVFYVFWRAGEVLFWAKHAGLQGHNTAWDEPDLWEEFAVIWFDMFLFSGSQWRYNEKTTKDCRGWGRALSLRMLLTCALNSNNQNKEFMDGQSRDIQYIYGKKKPKIHFSVPRACLYIKSDDALISKEMAVDERWAMHQQ
jgi:hypothetical protein